MDFNNIEALLRSGMSSADLAKQFTEKLNTAQQTVTAEKEAQKKEEEAKRKAAAEATIKRAKQKLEFKAIVDRFIAYVEKYYPEISADQAGKNEDIDELFDTVDSSIKMLSKLGALGNKLDEVFAKQKEEDPLLEFFKMI